MFLLCGQAFKEVLKSISDYQSVFSQCKAYIAGFAARAIAKVCKCTCYMICVSVYVICMLSKQLRVFVE